MSKQNEAESPFNQWNSDWSRDAYFLAKEKKITLKMMINSVEEKSSFCSNFINFRIEPRAKWDTDREDKQVIHEWDKRVQTEDRKFIPIALRWAQGDPDLFLEQNFELYLFLDHCLNHQHLAVPMHVALAAYPKILEIWPLKHRINFLEKWAPKYAHRTHYSWPNIMAEWCPESTLVLLSELLEKPEHASQFLCGEYAYFGWNAFKTIEETMELFKQAAHIAPYEVFRVIHLIELRFGDLLTGGNLIEKENFHYVFDSEQPTKELREKGRALARQIIDVADSRLCELYENENKEVSAATQNFAYQMRYFRENYKIDLIPHLSGLLLELVDSRIGRKLIKSLTDNMTNKTAPGLYRWVFKEHELNPRYYRKKEQVKTSWFNSRLRSEVIKHGWRFVTPRTHTNPKRPNQKEVQIVLREGNPKIILKHNDQGRNDYITSPREVMIPQDINSCGSVVFKNDHIQIRSMEMHPVEPPSPTMQTWSYL